MNGAPLERTRAELVQRVAALASSCRVARGFQRPTTVEDARLQAPVVFLEAHSSLLPSEVRTLSLLGELPRFKSMASEALFVDAFRHCISCTGGP